MATFNLQDYETVEERLRRFHNDWPTGRVITDLIEHDPSKGLWVCKSYIFRNQEDIDPAATGLAFEIDGQGMANKTSALENAETSAIGRALANMNYSGNKRASREEMQKVQRNSAPTKSAPNITSDDSTWLTQLNQVTTLEQARELYKTAQKSASKKVLEAITLKADTLK
jgi:hypothetical protein